MKTLETILKKPFPRPEPEEIRKCTIQEIEQTVKERKQQEEYQKILQSKTLSVELPNLLPYAEKIIVELLRHYGNHTFLFAARDAETFYDGLRTVLEDVPESKKPSVYLLPGSMSFMEHLEQMVRWGEEEKTTVREFISRYGMTQQGIEQKKILLFDTGFRGTIADYLIEVLEKLYAVPAEKIILSRLVCADSYAYPHTRQLMDFKFTPEPLQEKFPKSAAVASGRCGNINYVIATAFQLLPRYHGRYSLLAGDVPQITIFDSKTKDIDFHDILFSVNASIVNPLAALLVQKQVTDYFTGRREKILQKVNL